MKINYIQISNILSFKYYADILSAPKIVFDKDLNILIGQNGSGKSTALEVINFIFKKVIFTPYYFNQDTYSTRFKPGINKKEIITKEGNQEYTGFRLEPNWDNETDAQKIKIEILLDDIDRKNLDLLKSNKVKLDKLFTEYSNESAATSDANQDSYIIDIVLNPGSRAFTVNNFDDLGVAYLVKYHLYKELIDIYNREHVDEPIEALYEPFALIGGYRNYHSFTPSVSLGGGNSAQKQIQQIKRGDYTKSTNTSEKAEPAIFNLVRLRMAAICPELITTSLNQSECEARANNQDFVNSINEKLEIIDLKIQIALTDILSWAFSFTFLDTKRNRILTDINSLSAGQKAIIHLVLEAYGRGKLTGGLMIIDEPEIHLHYQFQREYLKIIESLSRELSCQYILVTHSESLINSETIAKIRRFSLDANNCTEIKSPEMTVDQRMLVKILDNTRSTHAFFASKVILVEGETDRYFYKALLEELKPELNQEITILDIGGKPDYMKWKSFFDSFGLRVYFISDLDGAFKFIYPSERAYALSTPDHVSKFLSDHTDLMQKIEEKYAERIYILKKGDLENYLGIHNKGLQETINFCMNDLTNYINGSDLKAEELKQILERITSSED